MLKNKASNYIELNEVIELYILLRWLACFGIFVVLIFAQFIFNYKLIFNVLYPLNLILVLLNISYSIVFKKIKRKNLSWKEINVFFIFQILFDYLILLLLIYFAGFLENPFILYFIFHIILTAFIFSRKITFIYANFLIFIIVVVSILDYYKLIPHFSIYYNNQFFDIFYRPTIFPKVIGLCSSIIFSAYLITEVKKKIEAKGKKAEIDLEHYKSIDKMKSDFILQVTHELRGPLAAIKGYQDILLRGLVGNITEDIRDNVTKANRRTGNLLNMISEMLDYAHMKDEKEVEYKESKINMKELLENNIELMNPSAKQKNIKFIYSCPQDLIISSNRDLLNIILSNLLNNAIKYSLNNKTVFTSIEKINDEIHISVRDEGIGIESENLEKIFEEFYRSPEAQKMEKDGTGLGLAIVKKVVTKLNGRIEVFSEKARGSTFHIFLKI